MNLISERALYAGLFLHPTLPQRSSAYPAGLLKLFRDGPLEEGVFAYGRQYLEREAAFALNPGYVPLKKESFLLPRRRLRDGGALNLTFKDALPDAWGRLVLASQNDWCELDEADMLLQTNADRVGAMVFSESPDMAGVQESLETYRLEDLAQAALHLQVEMDVPKAMRRLLRQGGSLGGARPKASLIHNGALWLAKFPARDDEVDVQLLEACTLTLAKQCGIRVPEFEVAPLGRIHALLLRRFDRPGLLEHDCRIHYLSAAAFTDCPYESDQGSYVKLAQHLRLYGDCVAEDLRELYRRLIFNVWVDNTDDHVKNHGLLHVGQGRYRLSPAFDLVPQLNNIGYMGMAVNEKNHRANRAVVLDTAKHFGLSRDEATQEIHRIQTIVADWRPLFESMGADTALLRRVDHCFTQQWRLIDE